MMQCNARNRDKKILLLLLFWWYIPVTNHCLSIKAIKEIVAFRVKAKHWCVTSLSHHIILHHVTLMVKGPFCSICFPLHSPVIAQPQHFFNITMLSETVELPLTPPQNYQPKLLLNSTGN